MGALSVENLNTIIKPTKGHLLFVVTMCHLTNEVFSLPARADYPRPLQSATLKGKILPWNTEILRESICVPIETIQNDSPENENLVCFKILA